MSTTIDERVVEMRFDNKHFEDNVQTSLGTIKQLRQSLNLTDAAKGLDSVNDAARRVNLSGLSGAAETVGLKFSAMYTMADQAMRNITNSAMNYGKRIISALTVDPIKTGFSEYETKMGSIQTIMSNTSSKGTTMEDVTRVIDELNTYADKTIYNFAEMTRNIGTFTAAGVGLEESASAIQGIANLAAASGSTSQQASTAMYQLSQALATGTVKLTDWNSVTNAGMGGEKFQEALKATAREHGIAVDKLIEKNGSFRDSLQEGWLSADILNATLRKFTVEGAKEYGQSMIESGKWTQEQADALLKEAQAMEDAATKVKTFTQLWDTLKESAQSGWSQTWEILVGDFEEAKETLSAVADELGAVIGATADARNNLLKGWKDLGGRKALVESFGNVWSGLKEATTAIVGSFREIFPAMKPEQLMSFTNAIKKATETFKNAFNPELESGKKNLDNLKRTFKGVFAVVDIFKQVLVAAVKAVASLFGGVGELGGGLLGVTAIIGDWLVKLRDAIAKGDIFNKTFQGMANIIRSVVKFVSKLISAFKEKIVAPGLEVVNSFLEGFRERMSGIGGIATGMKNRVVNAVDAIGSAVSGCGIFKFIQALGKALITIGSGIGKALGELVGGIFVSLSKMDFSGIMDFFNTLTVGGIALAITKFVKGFSNLKDGIGDALGTFGKLKGGVVGILDEVKGCFEAYQTQLKAGTLMQIAKAIALLTVAIVVLSLIDSAKLTAALGAITVLFTDLMVAMGLFSKISGNVTNVTKTVAGMMGVATAVLILSFALTNVARLSPGELVKGMAGIVGLTAVVLATAKSLSKNGKTVLKGATQMILFAAAIKILASVVKTLADLSWGQLVKGLVGVGALLVAVSVFTKTVKFDGKAMATATGIVILAASLKILASACKDFASMSNDDLVKGLLSVGAVLMALIGFTKLTGGASNMFSIGVGMIAISAAMKIFASAVKDMGSMGWDVLGKGMLTMAVALAAIAVAVKFMPATMALTGIGFIAMAAGLVILAAALKIMGSMSWGEIVRSLVAISAAFMVLCIGLLGMPLALPGAAALFVIAAALLAITPVLVILGNMSWGSIIKGLVALAGVFTILGVAGAVLAPLVPTMLGLAAAIALLGVGILGIGAGVSLLAAGLLALATIGTASALAIASALTIILTSFVNLIPLVIQKIGEGIVAFCQVIADGAPAIAQSVTAVALACIQAINDILPPLMECLGLVLSELLKFLAEYVPQIVEVGIQLIIALLDGIASKIDDVVESGVNIIIAFLEGVAKSTIKLVNAAMKLMIDFINGLADSIRKNTPLMIDAVNNLMDAVMEAIVAYFKNAVTKGGELVDKIKTGIKDGIAGLKQAGKDAIQGFIDGITAKLKAAADAAKSVGKAALDGIKNLLGIKSPSREFMEVGSFSGEGLINGLKSYSGKVENTAADLGSSALDSVKTAVSGLADAISGDIETQPTIRPVLDLSDVRSGANTIGSLLNGEHTMGVMTNVGAISSTMSHIGQNGSNGDVVSAINKLRQDIGKVSGTSYNINGITYDDGSNMANAIATIVREARMERRR